MLETLVVFLACALGQAAPAAGDDPRARAIAPFVDPDVLAIIELDLAPRNVRALAARLAGDRPPGIVAEQVKGLETRTERLREAGVQELFVIVSLDDLPGPPMVVVPLTADRDAERIGRLLCGKEGSAPISFPACATIHGALVAGTTAALERVRDLKPSQRPELSAAFAALGEGPAGLRLLMLPSPDARRAFQELVPNLPGELGGGSIADLTRGVVWVAAALDSPKPSFQVVIAASSAEAARRLERRGPAFAAFLESLPLGPAIPRLVSQLETEVNADRIRISGDAQVVASLMDSVLQPMREQAMLAVCTNNEKQIALAMHNYLSTTRQKMLFPPAFSTSKDGKPLLSWRVLILPYLEQETLYKEFHLDEPWDSPHNRTLIARMPEVFRCPLESADAIREGKTRYVAPRGAGTILRGSEPVSLKDVIDGTSNTIIFVDAGDERAVPWTKPEDWDVSPDANEMLNVVFRSHRARRERGTNAAFADGSVRFLHDKIKPATIRALLTYGGNEVISPEDL